MSGQDILDRLRKSAIDALESPTSTQQHFEACYEAALLIEALRKQTQWQPIETAPKDGTYILIDVDRPGRIKLAYWGTTYTEEDTWFVVGESPLYESEFPLYWQPLPQHHKSKHNA